MAFKTVVASALSLESPEALFRDIRTKKIPGLLSQQADLLREYTTKAVDKPDVALQLPTGSGKTLVGLLIGEWRRRKFRQRVVYLCPTNQLVHQVVTLAVSKYGLKVNGFVGKKSDYDANAKSEYVAAEAVAVTSYSSLFNTAPFFHDPDIIVLDDAHSGENYIPKLWSLRISRTDHQPVYEAALAVFLDKMSWADRQRLQASSSTPWEHNWVEKIPTPVFYERVQELIGVLDTQIAPNSDLIYQWRLIRDRLLAYHFFLDMREILIRPLIPPTFSHAPFARATQRVYMSATLGQGGDLERITGRSGILRLQVAGWEKQGIGRRFFVFPQRSLREAEADELTAKAISAGGRALAGLYKLVWPKREESPVSIGWNGLPQCMS